MKHTCKKLVGTVDVDDLGVSAKIEPCLVYVARLLQRGSAMDEETGQGRRDARD